MHGQQRRWEGEETRRKPRRHMWPVPATTVAVTTDSSIVSSVTSDSFSKDGRKISVGDCALFKPNQDTSPPFIGIIRSLTLDKKNYLQLGVNWLYRPADIKLGKGIVLEAAPNEIFYSFHKDETPAASLLHPCKVAFLRKGVELPSGISSFICRRVYDTSNNRLWWLTDQDYINERQEEVDQLLDKTRLEMHATVQSGGRSPKPLNGPTTTPQSKPGSDGAQNSTNSFSSQAKGRKRDRGDQGSESIKRERSIKMDDGHSGQFKLESTLKSEIAKITDKGGLVNFEGVEKLVQLMQPDRTEKKIDLSGRMMLADVISVTDRYDCLGKFVQLRGLSVLDEWLQEVHKGKTGDGSITKENDRPVEEFLFALLRALDKLPVDLHALQTCNVGKSVNHLRSHKNLEIQKKARGLVDTWKKRVEAEMNMNDAKPGSNQAVSWPNKPGFEVAHGGNRRAGGPSDVKSAVSQPALSKVSPVKLAHGDSSSKSTSLSPGSVKSPSSLTASVAIPRDSPCKSPAGYNGSEMPLSTIKEEKSSSSSQSQNNSQSCSSDHGKPLASLWKEDARSSTAGSVNASKASSNAARQRKLSNGTVGLAACGVQKETHSAKSGSVERKSTSEKVPQAGLTCDRTADVPSADNGNHRLIVRLPNVGRSPARSANGGSLDDPSFSRASSPRFPDKLDQSDRKIKAKGESCRTNIAASVNKESRHRNDVKDGVARSDDDDSPANFHYEEHDRTSDEAGKALETLKGTCSSSGVYKGSYSNDSKPGKSHEASFRSINVLIESCNKYSEAIPSMSVGDDRGMNLLASVAAGEMSKSEQVSPVGSPGRSSSAQEDSYPVTDAKRSDPEDVAIPSEGPPDDSSDSGSGKVPAVDPVHVKAEEQHVLLDASSLGGEKPADGRSNEAASRSPLVGKREDGADCDGGDNRRTDLTCRNGDSIQDLKPKAESPANKKLDHADETVAENCLTSTASDVISSSVIDACDTENVASGVKVEKETVEESPSCVPSETNNENKSHVHEELGDGMATEHKVSSTLKCNEENDRKDNCSENGKIDPTKGHVKQTENEKIDNCSAAGVGSVSGHANAMQSSPDRKHEDLPDQEGEKCVRPSGIEADQPEECVSPTGPSSSVTPRSDTGAKLDFDLNEGFPADEGSLDDPVSSAPPGCSSVNGHGSLSFPSPMSNGLPLVPVAAAPKGPFVPPENLLKSTGEIGWRGSAATSAFRPAEPRKVLEMPLSTADIPHDTASTKQGRPPLDIDLNEPDDRSQDDMSLPSHPPSSVSGALNRRNVGGLDLDLNRVDEDPETGQFPTSTGRRFEVLSVRQSSSGGFSNGEVNVLRNFDLNNGPGFDEGGGIEQPPTRHHLKNSVPFLPSVAGMRMNNAEFGNLSSWFPPGNSYPAVAIPSILPDRVDQAFPVVSTGGPQRILGPGAVSGGISFGHDGYRGQVLSSSPAVAFTPGAPFPYPGFPFGTNFPLPSTSFSSGGSTMYLDSSSPGGLCFPAIPSQLVGPIPSQSQPQPQSHYPRPYVISLPDGPTSGGPESSRRWVRQGLDLNTGPGGGGTDMDLRDERLAAVSSRQQQLSSASSQTLAEEQMRMYQAAGAALKRKEPEGGWDVDRFSYKQQPSWQ